jgi:hypothetical protein
MRKKIVSTVALALFLTGAASLPWAAAQETAKQSEPQLQPTGSYTAKQSEPQLKPTDSYKVEFTVNEMDNGKKINSRSYMMLLRAEAVPKWTDRHHLRVGSQVPIAQGGNAFTYRDVGMNIDCRLLPMGNGKVAIGTSWDYSSLGGEQGHDTQSPVIRHVRSDVEAVVPLDKPTVISEMDDVASTHRYVFEVKVTKITP